ncbi:hypothetical protein [Phenylobacterium sp.]|uniref:hypothetical protein n=1 Tax=Phenylobacterium sp. TaxID=1871053 RepID=UPI002FE204B8
MRAAAPLLAIALCACATVPPEPPDEAARWTMQASATAGAALVHADAEGREVLRIACRRNPQDLFVASAWLRGAGPVRLTIGEENFPLTALPDAVGLSAAAPWPDRLPAALMAGGPVTVSLGRRADGPHGAPDARTAAAFAIACRGPVG